jgi:hypothetical protein
MGSTGSPIGMGIASRDRDEPIAVRVLEAVADREGVDATQIDDPLSAAVDPEALNTLFERARSAGHPTLRVEFDYLGHRVTVSGGDDPTVSVE